MWGCYHWARAWGWQSGTGTRTVYQSTTETLCSESTTVPAMFSGTYYYASIIHPTLLETTLHKMFRIQILNWSRANQAIAALHSEMAAASAGLATCAVCLSTVAESQKRQKLYGASNVSAVVKLKQLAVVATVWVAAIPFYQQRICAEVSFALTYCRESPRWGKI